MTVSTLVTDYLGVGAFSAIPAAPPIATGALAVYLASDIGVNFAWNGTAWVAAGAPVFGSGAPSTLYKEGTLYFNTSATPYAGYVQHSGAWHAFGASSGGGSYSPDILAEGKAAGTPGQSIGKLISLTNGATETLLNLTGESGGIVTYLFVAIGAADYASTMTITADGATVFSDRACLFFGAEYSATLASFATRFIGSNNGNGSDVGFYSFIPIPFTASISITFTNESGNTADIWWTIAYQTGIANTWPRTQKLRCATGTLSSLSPYSVNTLLAATGLNPGKLLGIGFCIDSYPGGVSPPAAPLEGEFKIYVDGGATPVYASSGTEDYIGLSGYFTGFDDSRIRANPNAIQSGLADYTGVTFNSTYTWRGYHFHIMDQVLFSDGLTVTWDCGETSANGGVNFTGTVYFSFCVWYYTT